MIYEMISGKNPFKTKSKNKMEKLQMITDRDVEMRPEFSDEASSLLSRLLKRNVSCLGTNREFEMTNLSFGLRGIAIGTIGLTQCRGHQASHFLRRCKLAGLVR